jgi:F0F1-type ATP synthase assembly protein I
MGIFKFDFEYLLITAIISLVATLAIVFMINLIQPGLSVIRGGTGLFIYIGVFTANLFIEAAHQRSEKRR